MLLGNEGNGHVLEYVPLFVWNRRSQIQLALGTLLLAAFTLFNQLRLPHEFEGTDSTGSLAFRTAQVKDCWLIVAALLFAQLLLPVAAHLLRHVKIRRRMKT